MHALHVNAGGQAGSFMVASILFLVLKNIEII